ncbi:hypothetical protein OAJ65_00625 [Flavobacteriales bacterium]|nr:hypothetical protein [Flavobacteriales bacterium]
MKKILLFSSLAIFLNSCTEIETGGCIDPAAYNYESFADYDDGSCLYVVGCTDPAADNYNPEAGLEVVNGCDYSCDVVWYLTVSAALFMDQWDIDYYHFFLKNDNTSFGYLGAGTAYSYVPDCIPQLDASTLVETFSWQGNYDNSAGILQWEAWADDGSNILILDYEFDQIVYPNECIPIGLSSKKLKAYKQKNKEKKRKERVK